MVEGVKRKKKKKKHPPPQPKKKKRGGGEKKGRLNRKKAEDTDRDRSKSSVVLVILSHSQFCTAQRREKTTVQQTAVGRERKNTHSPKQAEGQMGGPCTHRARSRFLGLSRAKKKKKATLQCLSAV